jgi:hypothetical protein
MFLAGGYPPELVDRFVYGSDEGTPQGFHTTHLVGRHAADAPLGTELDALSVHMYLQFHYVWGRKKHEITEDGLDSSCVINPPLPGHDMPSQHDGLAFLSAEDAGAIQEAQRNARLR